MTSVDNEVKYLISWEIPNNALTNLSLRYRVVGFVVSEVKRCDRIFIMQRKMLDHTY